MLPADVKSRTAFASTSFGDCLAGFVIVVSRASNALLKGKTMNTHMCLGLVGVALCSVAIGPRSVVADTNRPSATIVRPKRDDTVGATLEVAGRLSVRGKPVVAVRNCEPGSAWHVQEAVEMTGSKTFKGRVRVGEGGEAPGTRFWIVVLTPRSPKEAEPLALGTMLTELPFGVPRSVKLPVQLAAAAQPLDGAAQPSSTLR